MGPELLAAAGIDHQLDVGTDGFARGLDEQLIRLAVAASEWPPAHLNRFETTAHGLLEFFPQLGRFIKEQRAVRFDSIPVVSSEQASHRLVADLAHQVPEGDVDAADGVLNRAAATLPKRALAQALANSTGLVGALTDQHGAQQFDRRLDQGFARHGAANADQSFVGNDFDDGVDVFFGLEVINPAALDGAARQTGDA